MFELSVVICDGAILLGFNNNEIGDKCFCGKSYQLDALKSYSKTFVPIHYGRLTITLFVHKKFAFRMCLLNMLSLQHTPIFK